MYSTAKAAVIHMTRCAATELGTSNVRVNSISPGAIATGIFGKAAGLPATTADGTADVMSDLFKDFQPISRSGMPDDVARTAVWLASDDASFVNGQNIVVDGGLINGRLASEQAQFTVQMREILLRAAE